MPVRLVARDVRIGETVEHLQVFRLYVFCSLVRKVANPLPVSPLPLPIFDGLTSYA